MGVVPDVVLTAKGIAGGLPLGGVTGRAEIMDAAHPGGLGGTFSGNPVATAAAIAVFDRIENGGLLAEGLRIERTLLPLLRELQAKHPVIADVRGLGAMLAIELVDPATGAPRADLPGKVAAAALQQGVLVLTAGTSGNVLRFLPSLAVSDGLLREAVGVLDDALTAATAS
jgi:4-aminobutyrate aminotransferase / (S)-3-amino-2-methylpropionate transaminase / 5-aminovalerate transaminase